MGSRLGRWDGSKKALRPDIAGEYVMLQTDSRESIIYFNKTTNIELWLHIVQATA
jgi:hypothetical protein